ncbi:hypothetical protein [Xanthomonas graminis]|uniref:hypothetical protein n=1 Tax=Xanthomonas graminis TaxID=3390026 RepID=UPI00030672E9|nr:hypothetical protein [Xanthomonas translucens]OAX61632.1 hypothetical protein A6R72_11415 [Xanthomonas translucens pv. graminis]
MAGCRARRRPRGAGSYAAELHYRRRSGAGSGRGELQALQRELAQAQPQGGTLAYEVAACAAFRRC